MKAKLLTTEILKNIKWITDTSRTKLNYLAGINRSIIPSHVTKLAKSLEKLGTLRPIVVASISFITGKPELYIIDGQHAFNALIRNGAPIPYIIIEIKDKRELVEAIALLNASSKSWCLQDYITAWSSLSQDYVKLNHYFEVYDFDRGVIASVLMGLAVDSGSLTRKIKSGAFKIVNEKDGILLLNDLTDVLKEIPRMNRIENRYLCREYIKFRKSYKKYNHKTFLQNLKKNADLFILATQEEDLLSEMFVKLCSK